MLYQDARYRVGLEQSLVLKFRLSPDVSVLTVRGQAEIQLVHDLQRIAAMDPTPGAKAVVGRVTAARGAYDEIAFEIIRAVYAHDAHLVDRLDEAAGDAAFARMQGIVSHEAASAQRRANAAAAALATDSASAKQAMEIAYAIGIGLIALFGVLIARTSARLHRARAAEFESMARMAVTDPLTELRNHRAFHDELARELRRATRGPMPVSLVMLDLDDLKTVNDSLGHQAGDERLQALADALRVSHRAGDSAFRIGGDEFAVVLAATRSWGAFEFVQRLAAQLEINAHGATVTAGIPEALGASDKDDLIREADLALISAKRINQEVAIYSDEMKADIGVSIAEDEHHTQTLANALALAVDAKDSYTRSHCQTVSQLRVVIARQLGADPERVQRLRLAGLLHDVGKIGVPDSILQKPGPLTDDEYEQMKGHSVLGAEILEAAGHAGRGALGSPPPRAHRRSRLSRRPCGGTDIPVESRIILVADAFEAMTSDRSYRLAPGQAYAVDELRRHAGTQFDREIVEALVRCLDNTGARAHGYDPLTTGAPDSRRPEPAEDEPRKSSR